MRNVAGVPVNSGSVSCDEAGEESEIEEGKEEVGGSSNSRVESYEAIEEDEE